MCCHRFFIDLLQTTKVIVFQKVFIGEQRNDKDNAPTNYKDVGEIKDRKFDNSKIKKIHDKIQTQAIQ